MGILNIFWKSYYLISDPNKTYKKGWDDAINGNPRHQYKMTLFFVQCKKTQDIYDKGYDDGLKEKLIRKIR
jgi:hypothetical protein